MGIEVKIPDIGDFTDIPIIEIFVKEGDTIGPDDPIVSLESDKATMDVPSPQAGVVEKILVKVGDKVSEGASVLLLKGDSAGAAEAKAAEPAAADTAALIVKQEPPEAAQAPKAPSPAPAQTSALPDFANVHASPAVRRIAREMAST